MTRRIANPEPANTSPLETRRSIGDRAARTEMRLGIAARFFRDRRIYLIFICGALLITPPVFAQTSREYQLKAVFLWRLAQFTTWPADAFEKADSPIVICVLGENPFGGALEAAVRDESAHGRSFAVRYPRALNQIRPCHILYFAEGAGPRQAKEIGAALAGSSILTVRDVNDLANAHQSVIRFETAQNKIKLQVDLKAANAARLVLDPRLLRSAEIIAE